MVFVHSRKDTVQTAKFMQNLAKESNTLEYFQSFESGAALAMKKMAKSRNNDIKELFTDGWRQTPRHRHTHTQTHTCARLHPPGLTVLMRVPGFGVHHAGMQRSDRSMVRPPASPPSLPTHTTHTPN